MAPTSTPDAWAPQRSRSRAAGRCLARGCVAALALGCAPRPLADGALPVGRSRETPAALAVAAARPATVAPAAAPTAAGAAAHEPERLCDLPDTAVEAPLFASNDANLRERGTQILDGVIACIKAGLLGERALLIVGYADPRGSPAYNDAIALERARAAQRYLIRHGVPPERVAVASRGAREALGEAPESWLYDRRVEIQLLPVPVGAPEAEPVPEPELMPEPEPVPHPDSVPQLER